MALCFEPTSSTWSSPFHPTGMVCALSVERDLVTEGVRGDGGPAPTARRRFMFGYVATCSAPRPRAEEEPTVVRRPHRGAVHLSCFRATSARSIQLRVKAGVVAPHGGSLGHRSHAVPRSSGGACRRCTPVHEARRRGHHPRGHGSRAHLATNIMGGVRVDAATGRHVPASFAAGEWRAGCMAPNRLGGTRLGPVGLRATGEWGLRTTPRADW